MAEVKLYGLYNDDDVTVAGCKTLIEKGFRVSDVYSPFPIHGIEKVLGIKWTRIAICAFIYGITGLTLAASAIYYFMIVDWPMNIGGKPNFAFYENIPSFVPILFEFTVLCAAHGMVITMMLRNKTVPGAKARNPHPKTTDDHFAVEITPSQNANYDKDAISAIMKETGAVEVFEK